ncbi:MFS transporter [Amycolatopsis lexingtonensis]|uniref:MFS transporter n=1 Tax=Amycolatopsis lexingtonensis TaxID=218822 RepID=UPI003F7102A0
MPPTVRKTVFLLFAAYAVDLIDRLAIGNALPQIGTDLHLDHAQRGLAVSVFFVAYALVQIPGGLLADRFGAVRMCVFAMLAWSVCTGLTAAAWSFAALLATRAAFGVMQGMFPAASVKALSERTLPEQRNTANGWVNASSSFAILGAGLLAAAMLPAIGWRGMFLAISGLGLLVALAWKWWLPPALPEPVTADLGPTPSRWAFVRSPAILGCATLSFGFNLLAWGVTTWVPSYLTEERGVPVGTAALLMTLPTVLGAGTIILGGRLADRLGGRPRVIVVPAMAVVGVLELLLPMAGSVTWFMVVLTLLYSTLGLCLTSSFSVPLRALPTRWLGLVAGLVMSGSQLAGMVAPYAFGFVVDHASYGAGFAMLAAGPVIAIVAAILVPQNAEEFRSAIGRRIGTTLTAHSGA